MKNKMYEWNFETIRSNPDSFIAFMNSKLDFDNYLNLFKENKYPRNISNDIIQLIKSVRDKIFTFFNDSESIEYFNKWKINFITEYTNHLLTDIDMIDKMECILLENKKLYKKIIPKIMKGIYEKTKTNRYDNYVCFESVLRQYQLKETGWNSALNLQTKEEHYQQWISTWIIYLTCDCVLNACDIELSKKYVADSGLAYIQIQNNFLNQMDLLMFNDTNELLWKEVYKSLLEIVMVIIHLQKLEEVKGGEL